MPETHALLELDARKRIYRHIEANPGVHMRQLSRDLEMPLGTLEYHLHHMESADLLSTREDGRFKAYFTNTMMDRRDKDVLYWLRQRIPRRISTALLLHPGWTHRDLIADVGVGASTVTFHIKKLLNAAIVREERHGRMKRYWVIDAERVANVLIRYRQSFLDDLVDRFAEAWLGINRPGEEEMEQAQAWIDSMEQQREPEKSEATPAEHAPGPSPAPGPADPDEEARERQRRGAAAAPK